MRTIVAELAKAKGYSLVIERNENIILFSLDSDDLTEEAIKMFDKQNKTALGGGEKKDGTAVAAR